MTHSVDVSRRSRAARTLARRDPLSALDARCCLSTRLPRRVRHAQTRRAGRGVVLDLGDAGDARDRRPERTGEGRGQRETGGVRLPESDNRRTIDRMKTAKS